MFGDVQVGTGAEVAAGKTLTVYYKGWLVNGTLFDQNIGANSKPFSFVLGEHKVIPGWEEALGGKDNNKDGKYMKVGGIRRLVVPPAAGYGAQAVGQIPANSLLIFDVQLLDVK